MKTKITHFTLIIFAVLYSELVFAQGAGLTRKTELSFEIDPVTFIQKGYSAHIRIKPKSSDHLLIGLGAYALDMPEAMVSLNPENKDKGWKVRLNQGTGLFGEYHFNQVNKGLFAGVQTSIQQFKVSQESMAGNKKFSNALAMGYGGYTLSPFKVQVYFKFWGGVGYTAQISGENQLNGAKYDVAPLTFFGTLHVGYTFK